MSRPVITKVIGMTDEIVGKKLERIKKDVLDKQMQKIKQQQLINTTTQALLQMQQQLMQQAAQDPEAQQMIMQMQVELENLQFLLQNDILITNEEVNRIRQYYQYSHKEFEEQLCSQALRVTFAGVVPAAVLLSHVTPVLMSSNDTIVLFSVASIEAKVK